MVAEYGYRGAYLQYFRRKVISETIKEKKVRKQTRPTLEHCMCHGVKCMHLRCFGPHRKCLSLQMTLEAEVESLKCTLDRAGEVLRLKQLDLDQATWQVKLHAAIDIFMQAMHTCTAALRWSPGHQTCMHWTHHWRMGCSAPRLHFSWDSDSALALALQWRCIKAAQARVLMGILRSGQVLPLLTVVHWTVCGFCKDAPYTQTCLRCMLDMAPVKEEICLEDAAETYH